MKRNTLNLLLLASLSLAGCGDSGGEGETGTETGTGDGDPGDGDGDPGDGDPGDGDPGDGDPGDGDGDPGDGDPGDGDGDPGVETCSSIDPLVLDDINPADDIVEVNLVAEAASVEFSEGVPTMAWTYNGVIGPVIEAKVGDTLIVHFTNNLPDDNETTVHWHGLELPAAMDGSFIAQNPIPAGGEFTYEFELLRASTYWFHPHVRSNEQVELGLQGMLIVRDPAQDAALSLPECEHLFVLDDVLLDAGEVAPPFPADPLDNALTQINGRIGETLLVNGKVGQELDVQIGRPQRIRMVNTSNSRFMRLSIPGHTLHRIGGDGGLLEQTLDLAEITEVDVNGEMISDPDPGVGLLLTPGERADVVFVPQGADGETLALEWHDIARGRHTAMFNMQGMIMFGDDDMDGKAPPQTMMTFNLQDLGPVDAPPVPGALEPITAIAHENVPQQDIIRVMFGHTMPDMNGDVTLFTAMQMVNMMMVGVPFDALTPQMAPAVTPNEVRIIEVVNMTGGAHNFHLHGFMFQHIETVLVDDQLMTTDVMLAGYLENKDTIILPPRPGGMGTSRSITRLAVEFSDVGREGQIFAEGKVPGDGSSGGWLYHCHLLEHSARGMLGFLQVVAP